MATDTLFFLMGCERRSLVGRWNDGRQKRQGVPKATKHRESAHCEQAPANQERLACPRATKRRPAFHTPTNARRQVTHQNHDAQRAAKTQHSSHPSASTSTRCEWPAFHTPTNARRQVTHQYHDAPKAVKISPTLIQPIHHNINVRSVPLDHEDRRVPNSK